jgi:xylan 1,4-beta-xylosidase
MTEEHGTGDDEARAAWEARIGLGRRATDPGASHVPPPDPIRAISGRGQVTLDWAPVPGAIGYLVHRADSADGPYVPLDHHGQDVLAVPHPPYADTTGEIGRTYHYAVTSLADVDVSGPLSGPVAAASTEAPVGVSPGAGEATVTVSADAARSTGPLHRPWKPMIGSEHLSHLLCTDTTGGRPIGAELAEALRIAATELGVESVRAHAILCDDLGVYREVDGSPAYDFSRIDQVYDQVLRLGLRPVVELSFMPRDLARDPAATVFAYRAIISPPRDWDRWAELVRGLARHLIDRYGAEEVRRWPFEVWNEANLEVFWAGTKEEYLRLYEVTAHAIKDVDPALSVGGPGSAAAAWNGDLLEFAARVEAPLDFLATHTYGSPPLDLRPLCARHGRADLDLLWTEWSVTPRHFNPIGDDVFAAAFLLRGMRSAAGRIDALSHWVVSDHFEELGRPPRLFHGGFGLLTVGNLRKPRYWALEALSRLGEEELATELHGDGAGSLVEAWAARHRDGRVGLLIWNGTLDQSTMSGAASLDRRIEVRVNGLNGGRYRVRHLRIDQDHSNVRAVWEKLGGGDWPTQEQWALLRADNVFHHCEPDRAVEPVDGAVEHGFRLPMPGISLLELTPAR